MSEEAILRRLDHIEDMLHVSHINEEKIMSGLSDAQAAVASLQAEQAVVIAELQALQAAAGDPDATVETLAQQINASVAAFQAAIPSVATATAAPASPALAPAPAAS